VDRQTGQPNLADLTKSYAALSAFKTEHDTKLAALPKKPEDYKLEFKPPESFKLPDGFQYKLDEKDPRVGPIREFALKHGLSQDGLNELVAFDAKMQIEALAAADAELQAEMKKLGENGPARVKAFEDYLKANVSTEEYAAMRPFIGNAAAFSAIEKLIAKALKQSVPAHLNGTTPPAPEPRKRPADIFYGDRKAS
jgi:hypothetical protein